MGETKESVMIHTRQTQIQVLQGEYSVSAEPNVVLSAILGSCVATCLWDPANRLGGMNHILLPGSQSPSHQKNKYGIFAMETLINELMKLGTRKSDLVAKVFGGARTYENCLQIGEANANFVRGFLKSEGIKIKAASLGGSQARRVRFYPESGLARQMLTGAPIPMPNPILSLPPNRHNRSTHFAPGSGDVELF
jgi:chemotaxis protein CheD